MGLDGELQLLDRRARNAAGRLRFNRALAALARWLPVALVSLSFSLGLAKFGRATPGLAAAFWGLTCVATFAVVWVAFRAATRPLPWQSGSLALDRQQDLSDRVTNALEFARVPAAQRSPLMQLCIDEAVLVAGRLDPAKAVRVQPPRALWYCVVLIGLVWLLTALPLRSGAPAAQPTVKLAKSGFIPDQDDLQIMHEMAEHWRQTGTSVETQQATKRFNQLLEELAQQRLDKHQVLERLQEIARDLGQPNTDKKEALDEALQGVARALQTNAQTKAAASALANRNLPDAEKALRELADKLRHKGAVDRKQLDDLRRALQAAAQESSQRQERLASERRQLEEAQNRLLHKKGANEPGATEQTQLTQNKRQLEHLERQQRQAEQGRQEISELDRQLAEAAQRLFEEMGKGADPLQAGADELGRMNRDQMSDQEKQELKKQLDALREELRQQGKGNQQRQSQVRQFALHARGQQSQNAAAGGKMAQPGEGGTPMPLLVPGESGISEQQADAANAGNHERSPAAGSGTDPNLTGESKRLQGKSQDVTAAGIDSGEGPSASSVVHGAAARGFVGTGYKRVYTEYKTVAEEALQHDQIPPGYDAYVRRYFQLIRPRD